MKIPLILSILLVGLVGCANIPMTLEQCSVNRASMAMEYEACLLAAQKYQKEQFEALDKRIVKRDNLILFLNDCDASTYLILVEIIKGGGSQLPNKFQMSKAIRKYGYPYTHDNVDRHLRHSDVGCMRPQDLFRNQW